MSSRNLPYIPIYIGDWEKDCNVLSLEAEAAWTRIIFKMFTNGKQSSYKIPTKGLQNLWRVSAEKVEEIIQEFLDYNICIINREGHYVEFICRRYVKENKISEVRRAAVQSRKDRTKGLQKTCKEDTKEVQNAEIEIEIENNKGGVGEKENPAIEQGPLGSEVVQEAARKSYANAIWVENVCMANNLTKDDLKKWMAKYNSSICNDRIANFDDSTYRKLFTGWLSSQFSKGYSLPRESQPEKKETIKYLNA